MGLLKKYLDFFGEDFDFFNWIVMFSFIVLMFSVQVVSASQIFLVNDSLANIPFQDIGSQSIVRLDNGDLVAVWENSNNDGACSISKDNGATWSTNFSESATVEHLTVATNGTGIYIVAQDVSGELDSLKYNYSEAGCPDSGWTFQGIPRFVSDEKKPWIEYDGTTDKYVMCYRSGNFYGFGYVDADGSNNWQSTYLNNYYLSTTNGIEINQAPAYEGSCSLSVDTNGGVHICAGLSDTENSYLQYYKSDDLFSTSIYNKSLGETVFLDESFSSVALDDCDINSKGGVVGITFSDDSFISDFFVTYISENGGESFEQQGIQGKYKNPSICIDESGVAQQFVINYTSSNQSISYFNFTNLTYGEEITILNSSIGNWSFASPLCHNFPLNNRMKFNSVDFLVFNSNTSELYYSNHTFQIQPLCNFTGDKTVMYSVSGNLSYYNSNSMNLSGVNVTLLNINTNESCSVLSDDDGSYYFSGLNSGNWSITPMLNDTSYNHYINYLDYYYSNDSLSGSTVFDDYQNLSCDVSLAVGFNTLDPPQIESYYSGDITNFEVTDNLGSDYSFNPYILSWGYRNLTRPVDLDSWIIGKIDYLNLNQSYHGQNFTVVRYGDCWQNNPINITSNSTSPLTVYSNTNFEVNLTVEDLDILDTLYGYVQFYINSAANFFGQKILLNGSDNLTATLNYGNFTSGDVIIAEIWAGDEGYNSSKLNLSSVIVQAVAEVVDSSGGGGGSGGGSTSSLSNNLQILVEGVVELGLIDSTLVNITLYNSGTSNFREIELSSNSSLDFINISFQEENFKEINSGQNKSTLLFIDSNSVLEGSYEVVLNAKSKIPSFIETKTIYVRISEDLDLGRVTERISLAQDLFRENSQCLELNDLLIQAQRLIDEGKLEEARVIVQDAITKCRGLVTSQEETPFKKGLGFDLRIILFVVSGLIILSLIVALVLRKPHFNLKKAKRKKWNGFEF